MISLSLTRAALLLSASVGLETGNCAGRAGSVPSNPSPAKCTIAAQLDDWLARRHWTNESNSRESQLEAFGPRHSKESRGSVTQGVRDSLRRENPNALVNIPARVPRKPSPGVVAASPQVLPPIQRTNSTGNTRRNDSASSVLAEKRRGADFALANVRPVKRNEFDEPINTRQHAESIPLSSIGTTPLPLELTLVTTTAAVSKSSASAHSASGTTESEPAPLPALLGVVERSNVWQANSSLAGNTELATNHLADAIRVAEVDVASNSELVSRSRLSGAREPQDLESIANPSGPSSSGVFGNLQLNGTLSRLHPEYYLTISVLLFAVFALVYSRRRPSRQPSDLGAAPAPVFSGLAFWPPSSAPVSQDATDRGATAAGTGIVGTVTATVGLIVTAVGAAALMRGYAIGQLPMQRSAMIVAAVGQSILLLGISAQLVHKTRRRASRSGIATSANGTAATSQAHPVWPPGLPLLPLNAGYPWPVATSIVGTAGSQAGQIAQLKAQLACLSQQLDQLGVSGPPTEKA